MNPFDLAGPPFLLFYSCLSALVIVGMRLLNRNLEQSRAGETYLPDDPYAMAFLRGGQAEAARVATVALVDRGLLKNVAGDNLAVSSPDAESYVKRPIERGILLTFAKPAPALAILGKEPRTALAVAAGDAYRKEFQRLGLLTSGNTIAGRLFPFLLALLLLAGVAYAKITIALARGRHNIGFLVILAIVASFALIAGLLKTRTGAGDLVLREQRERFADLKARAGKVAPGGATNEAAILTALWGVSILPAANFPYVKTLFPKAASTSSDSWISNSSGGCGGGGGSSDGGGGGGCGGGGGGCGGCGG